MVTFSVAAAGQPVCLFKGFILLKENTYSDAGIFVSVGTRLKEQAFKMDLVRAFQEFQIYSIISYF